jgi:hypothetical protein
VERARPHAFFRLVVVGGRAFVETYRRAYQTRDVFTQWGILQLLRRYPGRVPDLDLMFACDDPGQVRAADFPVPAEAPPVFRYCKDASTLDVVFPDWSFWGWPEVGIRPWSQMLEEVGEENERLRWPERQPYAFWKGNPEGYRIRHELLKCNVSNGQEWNARVFTQVRAPSETKKASVSKKKSFLVPKCLIHDDMMSIYLIDFFAELESCNSKRIQRFKNTKAVHIQVLDKSYCFLRNSGEIIPRYK